MRYPVSVGFTMATSEAARRANGTYPLSATRDPIGWSHGVVPWGGHRGVVPLGWSPWGGSRGMAPMGWFPWIGSPGVVPVGWSPWGGSHGMVPMGWFHTMLGGAAHLATPTVAFAIYGTDGRACHAWQARTSSF